MTTAQDDNSQPLYAWPFETPYMAILDVTAVREIVAALTAWLSTTDDGSELGIARRVAQARGRDKFIGAIKDTRAEFRDRGFDFDLHHVRKLIDQVWDENGWRNPYGRQAGGG